MTKCITETEKKYDEVQFRENLVYYDGMVHGLNETGIILKFRYNKKSLFEMQTYYHYYFCMVLVFKNIFVIYKVLCVLLKEKNKTLSKL